MFLSEIKMVGFNNRLLVMWIYVCINTCIRAEEDEGAMPTVAVAELALRVTQAG